MEIYIESTTIAVEYEISDIDWNEFRCFNNKPWRATCFKNAKFISRDMLTSFKL